MNEQSKYLIYCMQFVQIQRNNTTITMPTEKFLEIILLFYNNWNEMYKVTVQYYSESRQKFDQSLFLVLLYVCIWMFNNCNLQMNTKARCKRGQRRLVVLKERRTSVSNVSISLAQSRANLTVNLSSSIRVVGFLINHF